MVNIPVTLCNPDYGLWKSTLKMEGACSSEISISSYKTTRFHNPEDHNLNNNRREILKTSAYISPDTEVTYSGINTNHVIPIPLFNAVYVVRLISQSVPSHCMSAACFPFHLHSVDFCLSY
jgi:hypothetical protein